MTATPNNPLSPATSASDTEQRYHAGGAFAMKERALETASNVQQASGKAVVLDTTGTGIPTVETHDTDAPGAKDGPLARITPEADEQVDGKGRTLVEIDAELNRLCDWLGTFHSRICEHDDHLAKINRLIAAHVSKPCEPSKATGENELATAVQAADWREALVTLQFLPDGTKWLYTPDRKLFWSGGMWVGGCEDGGRAIVDDDEWIAEARRTCTEPPNLREWWPVKADDFKPTPEQQRFLASVCESCRAVVRAMLAKGDIPGVVKTNQS